MQDTNCCSYKERQPRWHVRRRWGSASTSTKHVRGNAQSCSLASLLNKCKRCATCCTGSAVVQPLPGPVRTPVRISWLLKDQ